MELTKGFTIDIIEFYKEVHSIMEKIGNLDPTIKERAIRLTTYEDSRNLSRFGTYNEKLVEKENGQFELSFEISLYNNNLRNPFVDYLVEDRLLQLTLPTKVLRFFITKITPKPTLNNITYSYVCQDSFSLQLSRQKILTSFSTDDENIWGANIGPKSLVEMVNKLFSITNIKSWIIHPFLNKYVDQFPDNLYNRMGSTRRVSFSIESSTPYNILMEICKLFNAVIQVDYEHNYIGFINKERVEWKGFIMRPEINLSDFSYSEEGSQLCNMMHVSGGEDAYGALVSVVPLMPDALCDFFLAMDQSSTYNLNELNSIWLPNPHSYPIAVEYNSGGILPSYRYYRKIVAGDDLDKEQISIKCYQIFQNGDTSDYEDNWTNLTSQELLRFFTVLYEAEPKILNNYGNYMHEVEDYFQAMTNLPQMSSQLYNFDYWLNNNLINKEMHDDIQHTLTINMRNNNILLNALNYKYNKLKYQLDSKDQQAEELISMIAAEEESRAYYTDEQLTGKYYYISQSKDLLSPSGSLEKYILINASYVERTTDDTGAVVWSFNEEDIVFGKKHNLDISSSLPDVEYLKDKVNIYLTTSLLPDQVYNVNAKYDIATDGKINKEKIKESFEAIILSYKLTGEQLPDKIELILYVSYDSIQEYAEEVQVNVDGLSSNMMKEYERQLHYYVWNESYIQTALWLYGKNFISRILSTKYNREQADKKKKHISIENKLIALVGKDYNSEEVRSEAMNNSIMYPTYADYIEELKKLSTYVGGVGTRLESSDPIKYMSFSGYYAQYKNQLSVLSEKFQEASKDFTMTSISDLLEEKKDLQKALEDVFYNNYWFLIRESSYEDSDQINAEGLYTSAYKEFLNYQKPVKSYKASFIATESITNYFLEPEISDLIRVYQDNLFTKIKPNCFIIESDLQVENHEMISVSCFDFPQEVASTLANYNIAFDNYIINKDKKAWAEASLPEDTENPSYRYWEDQVQKYERESDYWKEEADKYLSELRSFNNDWEEMEVEDLLIAVNDYIDNYPKEKYYYAKINDQKHDILFVEVLSDENVIINSLKSINYKQQQYPIKNIWKDSENTYVELRITGITKDLRSNVVQLEVEENTLYNTLVDRLLWNLKK